jgi:hypothetical protein
MFIFTLIFHLSEGQAGEIGEHSDEATLDTITKPVNVHKCLEFYYTHHIPPTRFNHSCGHLQGGELQRIGTSKYYRSFEPMHRCKILSLKIIRN